MMRTPVAIGSRVPPCPSLISRSFLSRLNRDFVRGSDRFTLRSRARRGAKRVDFLKRGWRVRMTSNEVTECGLWMAIAVRISL